MTESRPVKTNRRRSATESLLSIVLALDAVLVFFVMMTVFGLELLQPAVAFGGGATLIVILIVAGRLVSRSWGVWLGFVLQAAIISLGLVVTPMFFIGAIFAGIWTYCFVIGRRLDKRNAAFNHTAEFVQNTEEPHDQHS